MKKPDKQNTPQKPAFQRFYENIIENMPDGVAVVDKALKIKVFNQSIQQMTGFSSGRVLNKPFETIFFDNPSLKKRVEDVLKTGTTYTDFDQKLISRYKAEIFIGITAAPLLDSQGKIEGAVLIVRDLTHMKKLEEALRRKERFSSLGSLSAGMAHEIKNPLVGIRGAAQLLGEEAGNPEMTEYTQVIIKEVDRINKIVEELLNLSEPRKPEMKPVNIHKILDQILILEKTGVKEKRISFLEKYDPSLPEIIGDEKQLTQVFLNLIRNSIDSMPEGGEIKVTTGISSEHVLNLGSPLVRIEIEDCGKGIPQEIEEEIFTPFFTTKNEGTGLGLSVSNQIIEEHSGRLELQSGKEKGTIARVYLPAVRRKRAKKD